MTIRRLTDTLANQIAAGEVVERPASVVKELVENAIDASADRIDIATAGGGLALMRVTDNGTGIEPDELPLAVARHCTSKLDNDIFDIRWLGFRGEALPSIGSVSRLLVRSRTANGEGAEIEVDCGRVTGPRPAAANRGTLVEVRDLFRATPARLKFMKSERAESSAITDVVRRAALAAPHIRFTLSGPDRSLLELTPANSRAQRIEQVLGTDFIANSVGIAAERDGVRLDGFAGIASFHRANALHQFVYVNGRPVRDRMISGAIRAAYSDLMARDRHPVVALFFTLDPHFVDVNVHPAKADVRFRDPGHVRGLLIGAVREALGQAGIRPSTPRADATLASFRPGNDYAGTRHLRQESSNSNGIYAGPETSTYRPLNGFSEVGQAAFDHGGPTARIMMADHDTVHVETAFPLGAARAQLHGNYIVAQTDDSLVIVDQHAAHERLVYEALKRAFDGDALAAQMLLLPEIVDLPEDDCDRLASASAVLERLGLHLERFGAGAVAVRATPALLGNVDVPGLVRDLADEIAETGSADGLRGRLHAIASRIACHGSVRSGRLMRGEEMNALLRQMEATPGSGTCNHGRPTYIELKLSDIEKLFGRR
jgi:DNA mismatch repair protein MutL